MDNTKQPAADAVIPSVPEEKPTLSHRFSDAITKGMGSWKFVLGQAAVMTAWIGLNTTNIVPFIPHWDPNLILLNLALSTEAAFAGSFILMSQNRQGEKDRQTALNDYEVDVQAHRAINDLHRKVDDLLAVVPPEHLKAIIQARDAMLAKEAAQPEKISNDNAGVVQPAAAKPAP